MLFVFPSVSSTSPVISLTSRMQSVTYFCFMFLTKTGKGQRVPSYRVLGAWGGVSGKVGVAFSRKIPLLQVLFEPWYLGS